MMLDRSKARARTRAAQLGLGVVVLGSAAVGAVVFQGGKPIDTSTLIERISMPEPLPPAPAVVRQSADLITVGNHLGQIANHPKPPPPPTTEPNKPVDPPAVDQLRYLGAIEEPDRVLALLSVNGKQRIVGAGSSFRTEPSRKEYVVKSVDASVVVVKSGSVEARIERAVRTGPAITMVGNSSTGAGATGEAARANPMGATGVPSAYPSSAGAASALSGLGPDGKPRTASGLDPAVLAKMSPQDREHLEAKVKEAKEMEAKYAAEAAGDSSDAPKKEPK